MCNAAAKPNSGCRCTPVGARQATTPAPGKHLQMHVATAFFEVQRCSQPVRSRTSHACNTMHYPHACMYFAASLRLATATGHHQDAMGQHHRWGATICTHCSWQRVNAVQGGASVMTTTITAVMQCTQTACVCPPQVDVGSCRPRPLPARRHTAGHLCDYSCCTHTVKGGSPRVLAGCPLNPRHAYAPTVTAHLEMTPAHRTGRALSSPHCKSTAAAGGAVMFMSAVVVACEKARVGGAAQPSPHGTPLHPAMTVSPRGPRKGLPAWQAARAGAAPAVAARRDA